MKQCTFITGTDKQIIVAMNTFFEHNKQEYTTMNLFNTNTIQNADPKLHSLSTSLIDLHLSSHKNNNTTTIFLCFRSPEIPPLENIEDRLFSNYFNTELFFALELLRKSFSFLSNKKISSFTPHNNIDDNTVQRNIFVVLPQMDKAISSEKNIFVRMLFHTFIYFAKHMIKNSKYPVTLRLLQYHYTISFSVKINMIHNYITDILHIGKKKNTSFMHSFITVLTKLTMPFFRKKKVTSRLIIKHNTLPFFKKKKL